MLGKKKKSEKGIAEDSENSNSLFHVKSKIKINKFFRIPFWKNTIIKA